MKRFSIHQGRMGYLHCRTETLLEAIAIVEVGSPRDMIGAIHPDARDGIRIDERDRRMPYRVLRSMSWSQALATAGDELDFSSPLTQADDGTSADSPLAGVPVGHVSQTDAYWCGVLAESIRSGLTRLRADDIMLAVDDLSDALARYETYALAQHFDQHSDSRKVH